MLPDVPPRSQGRDKKGTATMTELRRNLDETHVEIICDHKGTTYYDGALYRCTTCGSVWIHGVVPGPHKRITVAK